MYTSRVTQAISIASIAVAVFLAALTMWLDDQPFELVAALFSLVGLLFISLVFILFPERLGARKLRELSRVRPRLPIYLSTGQQVEADDGAPDGLNDAQAKLVMRLLVALQTAIPRSRESSAWAVLADMKEKTGHIDLDESDLDLQTPELLIEHFELLLAELNAIDNAIGQKGAPDVDALRSVGKASSRYLANNTQFLRYILRLESIDSPTDNQLAKELGTAIHRNLVQWLEIPKHVQGRFKRDYEAVRSALAALRPELGPTLGGLVPSDEQFREFPYGLLPAGSRFEQRVTYDGAIRNHLIFPDGEEYRTTFS